GLRVALAGRQCEAPDPRGADPRRRRRRATRALPSAPGARRPRPRGPRALLRRRGGRRHRRPQRRPRPWPRRRPLREGRLARGPHGRYRQRSRLCRRDERTRPMTDRTAANPGRGPFLTFLGRPESGVVLLFGFYILLLVVFSLLSPFFMTTRNMMAIGSNIAFIGLMAAAGTPLIIAGGLDLSVAAI